MKPRLKSKTSQHCWKFSMPEKEPTRTADLDYFYMSIITVPNMETKGSMTTAPNLEAVVKLGESL